MPHRAVITLAVVTAACMAASAAAEQGFGSGNWGGNSVAVGRNTFYANGLVAQRVGRTEYFNNGLVGQRFGNLTLYNNGLVAGQGRRTTNTYYSNVAVGVPVTPQGNGRPGITVYGGGYPYPLGPGPNPFGAPGPRSVAPAAGPATPWATTPWARTPWAR